MLFQNVSGLLKSTANHQPYFSVKIQSFVELPNVGPNQFKMLLKNKMYNVFFVTDKYGQRTDCNRLNCPIIYLKCV